MVVGGWDGERKKRKARPSYLPLPVSVSSLWIIDCRWEQEFALQGGGYKAAWGQHGRAKISPEQGLSETRRRILTTHTAWLFITAVLSLKTTRKDTAVSTQCQALRYDEQLGTPVSAAFLRKYLVTPSVCLCLCWRALNTFQPPCSRLGYLVERSQLVGERQCLITRSEVFRGNKLPLCNLIYVIRSEKYFTQWGLKG